MGGNELGERECTRLLIGIRKPSPLRIYVVCVPGFIPPFLEAEWGEMNLGGGNEKKAG
jgi:hypothetical protein